MPDPPLSQLYQARRPSAIRQAQILFAQRTDGTEAIDVAIGNVSLPMHPAMRRRLAALDQSGSPFASGVVGYTPTVGTLEARKAFLKVIASSGFDTEGLEVQVTDGASLAMELAILGVCGPPGGRERPLLLIDPAYTNYKAFTARTGRPAVTVGRTLAADGTFELPSLHEIERVIRRDRPGALLVIPYDNPTGQFYAQERLVELARLCVEHGLWLISDEAYRELHYTGEPASSVWGVTEAEVPGIAGRRISIESASKIWNACGLRIGALVTDNRELHRRAVAEQTTNLCAGAIGQYVFGALAHTDAAELHRWYRQQRSYYHRMIGQLAAALQERVPEIVVSRPSAAIYSVIDLRRLSDGGIDAADFVAFCATEGRVDLSGRPLTLLAAPMAGFYSSPAGEPNPGRTQLRIAYVRAPETMALVPGLLAELLIQYETSRGCLVAPGG